MYVCYIGIMAQRVVISKAGGWKQLKIEEYICPDPKDHEIKIDVRFAGVNFADTAVRQGYYASAKKLIGWPITPGFEVSGVVISVGSAIKDYKIGDKVFGLTLFNGYSSQLLIPAEYVRKIPSGVSFEQAAGLLAVYMTSYYAACCVSRIQPKSTVLVHSASGGVGLSLSQVLRDLGCRVVGVVGSTMKVKYSLEYGASIVVDKSNEDLWTTLESISPSGYDAIFDPNGLSTMKASYDHLATPGQLFLYGHQSMLSKSRGVQNPITLIYRYIKTPKFSSFKLIKENKSIIGFNISFLYDKEDVIKEFFEYFIPRLESKTLLPLPIKSYAFTDVIQAHKDLQSGKTVGKLVLRF
jgi:synaptic vesicle membrane protein VAT-1